MAEYQCQPMQDLERQLHFAPPERRRAMMADAEQLYWSIDPEENYPYDFVVFRITSYRDDASTETLVLVGEALRHDLIILVDRMSDTLDDEPTVYDPLPLTVEQVADRLNVSTKTVRRYREAGLFARRAVYPTARGGRKRMVFLPESVARFESAQQDRLRKAASFARMPEPTRHAIGLRARRIASRVDVSPFGVAEHLARKYPFSAEAIRQLLLRADAHDPRFRVFRRYVGPLDDKQREVIFRAYRRGVSVTQMAERFGKRRETIYRVIHHKRRARLIELDLAHVPQSAFDDDEARLTLDQPVEAEFAVEVDPDADPDRLVEQLDGETETALFGRYHYLRHRASLCIASIDREQPAALQLDEAETWVRRARRVRRRLVGAYLPIVELVAKQHATAHSDRALAVFESEGERVLIEAMNAHDLTRGSRFGGFLKWSLMRRYAQADRDTSAQRMPMDYPMIALDLAQRHVLSDLDRRIKRINDGLDRVDPDMARVLRERFGIPTDESPYREPQTLGHVGRLLDMPAEQVHRVERRGFKALRQAIDR